MNQLDHPIFLESIAFIREKLGPTDLDALQQKVLERLIHSSGDFEVRSLLRFSADACDAGLIALKGGAPILVDTRMAEAAILPMSRRTINSTVHNVLDWAPADEGRHSFTRTGAGMKKAWKEIASESKGKCLPIVVIGSSPTALDALLDLVIQGVPSPSLIIAMPVGFIGVTQSKSRLLSTKLPYISLDGTRGGAGLAASTVNALLRASIDF